MKLHAHILMLLLLAAIPAMQAADLDPAAIQKLETIVQEEMREWTIEGVAIALIDDQRVVYARGFGEAKRDSVFRVGSVSKLFNAVAVMQLVEAGKLKLDAALPPELLPINPYPDQPRVTLRQLLSHRSGLPRESTVGGYFDPAEPGMARTVASMRPAVLATRPGEKTRYSNIGPTIAGAMVERASGKPYDAWQKEKILQPLGMTSSAWLRAQLPEGRLIVSHMRVADGKGGFFRKETPVFDLGTIPAGNLYSTVDDLAKFAAALCAGGRGLLKRESLEEMWKPQLTQESSGFGLGFMINKYAEQRMVSHNGAVYGHSTAFAVLPEAKIGVAVCSNEDIANGRIARIRNAALDLMLEMKGIRPPAPPPTYQPADLQLFAGDYESASYWARLEVKDGLLVGDVSGQPVKFKPTAELKFVADSRIDSAVAASFVRSTDGAITGFSLGTQTFTRIAANPPPLPPEWRAYLGSFGHDFMPLVISERHGHLYAMTENMVDYRLTPVNRNTCLLPPGMYVDEHLIFLTDAQGRPERVNLAGMYLERRKN